MMKQNAGCDGTFVAIVDINGGEEGHD